MDQLNAVTDGLVEAYKKKRASLIRDHELRLNYIEELRTYAIGVVTNWVANGVADIDTTKEALVREWLGGDALRTQIRALASKLDRPFIPAYRRIENIRTPSGHVHRAVTHLILPQTKRLHNLAGALLVVSSEAANEAIVMVSGAPAQRVNTAQQWHFYFQGTTGEDLLLAFKQQCREDPVFRVALRL